MAKSYKPGRLGEEIKKIISDMLLRELKDPRFSSGLVSITGVDVSPDGSYATVYVTELTLGKSDNVGVQAKQELLDAFSSAKGLIKSEIGKRVKVRYTPELVFKMDISLEYGQRIDEVISELGIEKYENDEDEE